MPPKRKAADADESHVQTRLTKFFGQTSTSNPPKRAKTKHQPAKNKRALPAQPQAPPGAPHPNPTATAAPQQEKRQFGAAIADYEPYSTTRRAILSEDEIDAHQFSAHRMCKESFRPSQHMDDVRFFPLDYTYTEQPNATPEQQIYGVCHDGTSVCVRITGFEPYMQVAVPPSWIEHYCNNDRDRVNSLCMRWHAHLRTFTQQLLESDPRLRKRYGRLLRDGHVILPPTEDEVYSGIVEWGVKDAKGFRMDFTGGDSGPKQIFTPMMRLRLASPKLVPFVRQLLWHPLGLDDRKCALCGKCDEQHMLVSPLGDGHQACDQEQLRERLGPKFTRKQLKHEWYGVLKHHGECPARFHGQCARMWSQAMRLRGQLPDGSPFIARCPCCTSDVVEFQRSFFNTAPAGASARDHASWLSEDYIARQNPLGVWDDAMAPGGIGDDFDADDEPVGEGLMDMTQGWEARNRAQRKREAQDRKRQRTSRTDHDKADADGRSQVIERGWFYEFQEAEMRLNARRKADGTLAVAHAILPAPNPTEYEDMGNDIRAAESNTLPYSASVSVYEANVDFVVRHQIDAGIAPSQWYYVPRGQYTVVNDHRSTGDSVIDSLLSASSHSTRHSTCALEVICKAFVPQSLEKLYPRDPPKPPDQDNPQWAEARALYRLPTPPITCMYWDAEMETAPFEFPQPTKRRVIQVGTRLHNTMTNKMQEVYFVVGSTSTVKRLSKDNDTLPYTVYNYDTEPEMLAAFFDFDRVVRPNVHVTWNGNSFDIPYLLARARLLGMHQGRNFACRARTGDLFWKPGKVRNADITQVYTSGTVVIDGMYFTRTERAGMVEFNNLNTVAESLLGKHKVELDHNLIGELQQSDQGRCTILEYLEGDVCITYESCSAMNMLPNIFTKSLLTHTSAQNLLQRGTQFMWMCILRHDCSKYKQTYFGPKCTAVAFPCVRSPSQDPLQGDGALYEGAIVIEPRVGFYKRPVATLDFAGLYPHLMMKYNLCFSTFVSPEMRKRYNIRIDIECWQRGSYMYGETKIEQVEAPNNPTFASERVFRGIMPSIMERLKAARGYFKRLIKDDERLRKKCMMEGLDVAPDGRTMAQIKRDLDVYDVMQTQIKLIMNSGYGFVGLSRTRGQMAMPMVAESVTLCGQHAVQTARITTEQTVCEENGYSFNVKVIYGDTDSVFFTPWGDGEGAEHVTVAYMMQLGIYLAREVTKQFGGVLELEFEKVYCPFLLKGKKNYMGVKWEPNLSRKVDRKGIRSKRRDANNVQREATESIEVYAVSQGDVERCIDEIGKIIARTRYGRVPLHDLAFSGSFSKGIFNKDATASAAWIAARAEYERSGRVIPPGERLRYVYVYVPHVKRDKSYRNTQTAQLLSYAQQKHLTYDHEDAIERIVKAVMPLVRIVAASEWKCSMEDAERRLKRRWFEHDAFTRVRMMYFEEQEVHRQTAEAFDRMGVQRSERCMSCRAPLEKQQRRHEDAVDDTAYADERPGAVRPIHRSATVMRMVRCGNALQVRVEVQSVEALVRHYNENTLDTEVVHIVPQGTGHQVAQARVSGSGVLKMLQRWCDSKHVLYSQRYGERQKPKLCASCLGNPISPADQEEFARVERETICSWDKCRTCSGAAMRGSSTVIDCNTYSCTNYGNRKHYSNEHRSMSRQLAQVMDW